ncbi:hypothetical protein P170DRAFT_5208 [Aspergillus steynii IBT 23096]|uniref:Uncharacterized protein n=1 Tax=Aspergillus steynii IBT 23096 TaxID=1392250 RepID=A0A2I2GLU5_9EURO|nr:uncharacterized protein P170DRAFT_5208 [Aspergillus steynii IBT 23096]PLB53829.1 hypothetical protein P170DRAFT_5208 [Aspergillus steynii IBT 23096]
MTSRRLAVSHPQPICKSNDRDNDDHPSPMDTSCPLHLAQLVVSSQAGIIANRPLSTSHHNEVMASPFGDPEIPTIRRGQKIKNPIGLSSVLPFCHSLDLLPWLHSRLDFVYFLLSFFICSSCRSRPTYFWFVPWSRRLAPRPPRPLSPPMVRSLAALSQRHWLSYFPVISSS